MRKLFVNDLKSIYSEIKPILTQGPFCISFSAKMDEQLTTKGPQVCGSNKIFSMVL